MRLVRAALLIALLAQPAAAERVKVTFRTIPEHCHIVQGGADVGVAPGPVEVETTALVVISAKGFASQTVSVNSAVYPDKNGPPLRLQPRTLVAWLQLTVSPIAVAGVGIVLLAAALLVWRRPRGTPPIAMAPMSIGDREPEPGTRIGSYALLEKIGEGGTGRVFRGRCEDGTDVALKVLKLAELPDPEEFRRRMGREIRILKQLDHPSIVRYIDWGESPFGPFLVEELVVGHSLRDVITDGGLPLPEFRRLFGLLLLAIGYAHDQGIVHRDLKPMNILLPEGGLKITDFGLARSDFMTLITRNNMMGTPAYMAPEQFNGEVATPSSDQYALGILAYEMLVGQVPFTMASFMQLMGAHLMQPPVSVQARRADVPPALDAIVMRMLGKKAEQRFPSLEAVLAALSEAG